MIINKNCSCGMKKNTSFKQHSNNNMKTPQKHHRNPKKSKIKKH